MICVLDDLNLKIWFSVYSVDLSGWRTKIEGEMAGDDDVGEDAKVTLEEQDGSFHQHEEYHDGVLTIGCCGRSS